MLTTKEYADSLRELADFYDLHPEVETPTSRTAVYATDTKENVVLILRALGSCEKIYEDSFFKLRKKFNTITLEFVFMRNAVCTPRVVGQREVEAKLVPERLIPSEVIPAYTEDIIEWDCEESLLAPREREPS